MLYALQHASNPLFSNTSSAYFGLVSRRAIHEPLFSLEFPGHSVYAPEIMGCSMTSVCGGTNPAMIRLDLNNRELH